MRVSKEILDIIQDHARVTDTLDMICSAIENGIDMPNFVPVCNDVMVSDQLTKICETITELRKKQL